MIVLVSLSFFSFLFFSKSNGNNYSVLSFSIQGEKSHTDRSEPLHRETRRHSEELDVHHPSSLRDSHPTPERRSASFHDEDDMSDPNLDRAATRIQASYRGYKTRKELNTTGSPSATRHDHHKHPEYPPSISPQPPHPYASPRSKNSTSLSG